MDIHQEAANWLLYMEERFFSRKSVTKFMRAYDADLSLVDAADINVFIMYVELPVQIMALL